MGERLEYGNRKASWFLDCLNGAGVHTHWLEEVIVMVHDWSCAWCDHFNGCKGRVGCSWYIGRSTERLWWLIRLSLTTIAYWEQTDVNLNKMIKGELPPGCCKKDDKVQPLYTVGSGKESKTGRQGVWSSVSGGVEKGDGWCLWVEREQWMWAWWEMERRRRIPCICWMTWMNTLRFEK